MLSQVKEKNGKLIFFVYSSEELNLQYQFESLKEQIIYFYYYVYSLIIIRFTLWGEVKVWNIS